METLADDDGFEAILKAVESTIGNSRWFPCAPGSCQVMFRGEPYSYETALLPKVFRPEIVSHHMEHHIYEEFQRQHPEYAHKCPSELDWLNVMQHHGVPTRLLDWTFSLPVALYFATQISDNEKSEMIESDNGVLYYQLISPSDTINPYNHSEERWWPFKNEIVKLVHARSLHDVEKWLKSNFQDWIGGIKDSFTYRPRNLHSRIKNQHGLFTISIGKTVSGMDEPLEIISPQISCLERTQLIEKYIDKSTIYCCKNKGDNKELLPKMRTKNDHNRILMLVDPDTTKISIWMQDLSLLLSSNVMLSKNSAEFNHLNHSPQKNNLFTTQATAAILISALRQSDLIVMTKVLTNITKQLGKIRNNFTNSHYEKIFIPKSVKIRLRKQLSLMGLNYSFLFPEPSNFFKGFSERLYFLEKA